MLTHDRMDATLIDPDLFSLLAMTYGSLGGICGLFKVLITSTEGKQGQKLTSQELRNFRRNINEIRKSLEMFDRNFENMEKFIAGVNSRDEEQRDIFELQARFGEVSLLLNNYEIDYYIRLQSIIYDSMRRYSTHIIYLAKFLSTHLEYLRGNIRLSIACDLVVIVYDINQIVAGKPLSVREYVDQINNLATAIEQIIAYIEHCYMAIAN